LAFILSIHVYVGPTLARKEVSDLVPGACLHPPVGHGDLLREPFRTGDTIVIIDGHYHQQAPVRHKEILHVLAQGVHVVGCSSMGALRAAELHRYGMVGAGAVFRMYADGTIDRDDEVAVAHTPAPECRRLSDALVTIRHAAASAVIAGAITDTEAARLIAAAARMPYALRSWAALRHESDAGGSLRGAADQVLSYVAEHPGARDIKAADARFTLAAIDALAGSGDAAAIRELRTSSVWRTSHLQRWRGEFEGGAARGRLVSRTSLLHHEQIYRRSFIRRWRSYVLRQLHPGDAPPGTGPALALSAASARGIDWSLLSAQAAEEWLLPGEMTGLSEDDRLLTVLVRSFRHGPGADHRLADARLLPPASRARQLRVRLCLAYNGWLDAQHPGRHITHLRPDALARHLAQVWRVVDPADGRMMQAAARDRGFTGMPDAISAVRPFYLFESRLSRVTHITSK
jgi:hypothetical protein